jgi:hypothetical protein
MLQKYLLSNVHRSPDDPAAAAAAAPADDPAAAAAAPADDPAAAAPAAAPAVQMVPVGVAADLRVKLREADTEKELLRRRATDAEALAARLARGEKPDAAAAKPAVAAPATTSDQDVDQRARAIVLARDFRAVSDAGLKTYGAGWDNAVRALDAYGINNDEFVASVMEIDRDHTHEIMHAIAQDGEKAVALAAMSPARRIAEITRMSMAKSEPKIETDGAPKPAAPVVAAKTVSKAPAPAPALEPSASKVVDWRDDKASDDEFSRGWNENQAKRHARR